MTRSSDTPRDRPVDEQPDSVPSLERREFLGLGAGLTTVAFLDGWSLFGDDPDVEFLLAGDVIAGDPDEIEFSDEFDVEGDDTHIEVSLADTLVEDADDVQEYDVTFLEDGTEVVDSPDSVDFSDGFDVTEDNGGVAVGLSDDGDSGSGLTAVAQGEEEYTELTQHEPLDIPKDGHYIVRAYPVGWTPEENEDSFMYVGQDESGSTASDGVYVYLRYFGSENATGTNDNDEGWNIRIKAGSDVRPVTINWTVYEL